MPVPHLQYLMGHKKGSKITLEHYVHVGESSVRDALLSIDW
jgi:hypothetical protein